MSEETTRYALALSPIMLLRSSEDWTEWLDHIKKAATLLGVWEYCDSATEKEDLPVLKEPKPPVIADTDPLELDEAELEDLKTQVSKYRKERAEFRERRSALDAIETMIRCSVSDKYWHRHGDGEYYSLDGPWRKLRGLSEEFGGPTETKLEELEDQWSRLQALAKYPLVHKYIRGWDRLFKECADLRMVKSLSKNNRENILLNALMELASGNQARGGLVAQSWVELPNSGWWADDGDDDQTEKDDGYWDYLWNADADTPDDNTTDDQGQSRCSSPSIGWQVPAEGEW